MVFITFMNIVLIIWINKTNANNKYLLDVMNKVDWSAKTQSS